MSEEKLSDKKKTATSSNERQQLPIHLYTRQFTDKKATQLLMLDMLLGVDIDFPDYHGRTPLHYAVMNDCNMFEKLLLDRGAAKWACDDYDRCPEEYRRWKQPKCMWDKFI